MSAKTVFPISTLSEILEKIASLSDGEFRKLVALVETTRSFSPYDDDVKEFSRDVGAYETDVRAMLSFLRFLYDRSSQDVFDQTDLTEFVQSAVEEAQYDPEENDRTKLVVDRLGTLLKKNELHDKYEKINRLERGLLPNAVSFQSLVDLRPDFDDAGDKIQGFIPVVTFRVVTNSADPGKKYMTFHIPVNKIDQLIETTERLKKKLNKIKEQTK